jgi:hypothetical protein
VLSPEDQKKLMRAHPSIFAPAKGAWGRKGSTVVRLEAVDAGLLKKAMQLAYRRRAMPVRTRKTNRPPTETV